MEKRSPDTERTRALPIGTGSGLPGRRGGCSKGSRSRRPPHRDRRQGSRSLPGGLGAISAIGMAGGTCAGLGGRAKVGPGPSRPVRGRRLERCRGPVWAWHRTAVPGTNHSSGGPAGRTSGPVPSSQGSGCPDHRRDWLSIRRSDRRKGTSVDAAFVRGRALVRGNGVFPCRCRRPRPILRHGDRPMTRSHRSISFLTTETGNDVRRGKRRAVTVHHGPTPDEVERRLAASGGLFARLTPEQREALRTTEGPHPEIAGVPRGARRR
jgi:hypothetical protein